MNEVTLKVKFLTRLSTSVLSQLPYDRSPDKLFNYTRLLGFRRSIVRNMEAVLGRSYLQQVSKISVHDLKVGKPASIVNNGHPVQVQKTELGNLSWGVFDRQEIRYFTFLRSSSLLDGSTEVSVVLPLSFDIGEKLERKSIMKRRKRPQRKATTVAMHVFTDNTERGLYFDYNKYVAVKRGVEWC